MRFTDQETREIREQMWRMNNARPIESLSPIVLPDVYNEIHRDWMDDISKEMLSCKIDSYALSTNPAVRVKATNKGIEVTPIPPEKLYLREDQIKAVQDADSYIKREDQRDSVKLTLKDGVFE